MTNSVVEPEVRLPFWMVILPAPVNIRPPLAIVKALVPGAPRSSVAAAVMESELTEALPLIVTFPPSVKLVVTLLLAATRVLAAVYRTRLPLTTIPKPVPPLSLTPTYGMMTLLEAELATEVIGEEISQLEPDAVERSTSNVAPLLRVQVLPSTRVAEPEAPGVRVMVFWPPLKVGLPSVWLDAALAAPVTVSDPPLSVSGELFARILPGELTLKSRITPPPFTMVPPVKLLEPLIVSVPTPNLVRLYPLPPSPMAPTVSPLLVLAVLREMTRLPPSVTAPLPMFRAWVPTKVKSPFQYWALVVSSAMFPAVVLSRVPSLIVSEPLPMA